MTTPPLDGTKPVRAGEELDLSSLQDWMQANIPGLTGELVVEQFPSGHSNLTYLLHYGAREMVLRRPPVGAKIKTAHDMGREHRILSGLAKTWDKVPTPLGYCAEEKVLGAPFYVMERLRGVILRGSKPKNITLSPEQMRATCESLIDGLVEIHGVDLETAGLADLGKPKGYVERQVKGWTGRYQKAKTDDIPQMEEVSAWLVANMPPETEGTLIHNDYKYDNVVLDPDDLSRIIGVLDWEMATLGDPMMDLGCTLGYWIEADDLSKLGALPFGPTAIEGNLNRREVAERYAQKSGRDLSNMLFYYVFGLFKIAVIIQQIYARYKKGLTKDQRFAFFIFGVQVLSETAARAIELQRIDRLWSA